MPEKTRQMISNRVAIPNEFGAGTSGVISLIQKHFYGLQIKRTLGDGSFSTAYHVTYTDPKTKGKMASVLKLTDLWTALSSDFNKISFQLDSDRVGGEWYPFLPNGKHVIHSSHAIVYDNKNKKFLLLNAKKIQSLIKDFPKLSSSYSLIGSMSPYIPNTQDLSTRRDLTINQIRVVANQIFEGINALHKQELVHRDIKPENILVTKDLKVTIIDLGTAVRVSNHQRRHSYVGTMGFLAHEVLDKKTRNVDGYGKEVDLYSIGMTLFSLISNGRYLADILWPEDLKELENGKKKLSEFRIIRILFNDEYFLDFMDGLTNRNPDERMTVQQAFEHPFLTSSESTT